VVSTCGAMWQGMTRFERMKIYKDLLEQVVAPRFGIFPEQLQKRRHFRVMIGVGHDDHDVLQRLGNCFAHGHCSTGSLVPMDDFDPEEPKQSSQVVFFKKFDDKPSSNHHSPAPSPSARKADAAPRNRDDNTQARSTVALLGRPLVLEVVSFVALLLTLTAVACTLQRILQGRRRGASEMFLAVEESGQSLPLVDECGQSRLWADECEQSTLLVDASEQSSDVGQWSSDSHQFVNSPPPFDHSRLPTV